MRQTLWLTIFTTSLLLLSPALQCQEAQRADGLNQTLFDETLFDFTLSGVSRVDYAELRENLLAVQASVESLTHQQQAFYWYNLALASKSLALPSTQTIPPMNKALSLAEGLEPQQHFKILTTAIDVYFAYQQHDLVLQSVEQLRTLTQHELDPQTKRLPVKYENLRAFALYQSGMLKEAETSYSQLILEAEEQGSERDVNWYTLLSAIYHINKNVTEELAILRKQLAVFPSNSVQARITFLQTHPATQD